MQSLRGDFENTKMKEGELLYDFCARLLSIVNQLKRNGEEIQEIRVIKKYYDHSSKNLSILLWQSKSQKIWMNSP